MCPPKAAIRAAGFRSAESCSRTNTGDTVEKSVIRTEAAPAPFQGAPYNQAIVAGDLVFVAGQTGLVPGGTTVEGDIGQQTEQALANLAAILEAAGSSLENLVKTTVFLTDLGDFQAMNEVYTRHVGDRPPARSTVEVSGLPAGAAVEIEAVAHL
jgi:2-iminobutanoate/2-iminopropanoate deaminase